MLTALDKVILRTWSALEDVGEDSSAETSAACLACDVEGVAKRLAALRACGQLPWPDVEQAS